MGGIRVRKTVARGAVSLVGIGGGVLLVRESLGRDNFDRSISFYQVALPGYVAYKMTDYRTWGLPQAERDARFEVLHRKWAPRALEKILELRGFYIKVGQMGASNIGNAFPDVWVRTLEVLQDSVPHKGMSHVRDTIETEFQRPMEEVFTSFEPTPIGAASIGQVHRAVLAPAFRPTTMAGTTGSGAVAGAPFGGLFGWLLRPSSSSSSSSPPPPPPSEGQPPPPPPQKAGFGLGGGFPVVVKVQYPEVEARFRSDVATLLGFCRVAQPEHVKALEELEKQFKTEFDYTEEAANLAAVRANLAGPFPEVVVPLPVAGCCRKRVLVMEDLSPATKLADGLRQDERKVAALLGVEVGALRRERVAKERAAVALGRPKQGPSAPEFDRLVAAASAKMLASNAANALFNRCFGWLPFVPLRPIVSLQEALPLNHARVVDDLLAIHGHEIFVDGCFNGDPHPGNFLLVHGGRRSPRSELDEEGGERWRWWPWGRPRWLCGGGGGGGGWERPMAAGAAEGGRGGSLAELPAYRSRRGLYATGDRLGLIDYGQVKRLAPSQRLQLARLFVALEVDDPVRVAAALHDMGHRTARNDVQTLYTIAKLVYDCNDPAFSRGRHIQHVLDELQRVDPVVAVAEDFVLVGRVCAMLRGLGFVLRQPRSTSRAWLPLARSLLLDAGEWDPLDDARLAERAAARRKREAAEALEEAAERRRQKVQALEDAKRAKEAEERMKREQKNKKQRWWARFPGKHRESGDDGENEETIADAKAK